MSGRSRIERRLPTVLADLGAGPYPDYTDTLLARTAATRQRPGWVFPKRWLPMSTVSSVATAAPRIPWRVVGAVALLLLALAVGAVLIAGGQPRVLPAPFGPAANGLIAYAVGGDIYTADPVTGQTRAIVTGPETDTGPVWSRDGTRFVFVRSITGEAGGRLVVSQADGSDLTPITPDPLVDIASASFSPDGDEVIFVSGTVYGRAITIAKADGSGVRTLELGMSAVDPAVRPPDGKQIAFTGSPSGDTTVLGLYVVNTDGSGLRTLVEPARYAAAHDARWSPDGSLLAYGLVDFTVPEWTVHTRVMSADGSDSRILPMPDDAHFNYYATWSNDGTRIAMVRGYAPDGDGDNVAAIVPANGSGTGVETVRSLFAGQALRFEWAPDDTSVLVVPETPARGQIQPQFMDPVAGDTRPAPYTAGGPPAWQRLASPSQ